MCFDISGLRSNQFGSFKSPAVNAESLRKPLKAEE